MTTTEFAPTVNSVSPAEGTEQGGTTVTILGTGFTGALAIYFGYAENTYQTVVSAAFTVVSDTQITATSPVSTLPGGVGPVNVVVMGNATPPQIVGGTPGVPSNISEASIFTYTYDADTRTDSDFTNSTVTHKFVNADGTTAAGYLVFTLTERMTNGNKTYEATRFEATLDGSGNLSQVLVSNIDTDTQPAWPWYARWRVDFHITGSTRETYYIVVPAGGGTVDLFDLIPTQQQVR